ncbi:MAG: DNA-processing protein DprA [Burkholderiales bacterium]
MPLAPDIAAWLRLSLTQGLGGESFRKLLSAFGGPEQILEASRASLTTVVNGKVADAIRDGELFGDPARVETWLADTNNHVVTLADDEYPQALLQTADPPPLIYVKGRRELLNQPAIAIVGSRNATAQGKLTAESFATALSNAGLCVVSGLALGIDAAAHRGGLAGLSSTVAVVGTGLDKVYPARNRDLAHVIAEKGAIISEFPLGAPPQAANFPRRNRIISGMTLGCLVVEAALSSGSLITARIANELGKDVFAIPGSIHSTLSKGCHVLIKQGAKLVDDAADILDELRLPLPAGAAAKADSAAFQHPLLAHMAFDPCDIDTLAGRAGLPVHEISAALVQLELDGVVAGLPGGLWQRIS